MSDRPHFILQQGDVVTAAGALFFYRHNNELFVLLQQNEDPDWRDYKTIEDLGGKVEPEDASVYETIAREVSEETNGVIPFQDILERVSQEPVHYKRDSKYALALMPASRAEFALNSRQFGQVEYKDNFPREIRWWSWREVRQSRKLAHRLQGVERVLRNRGIL